MKLTGAEILCESLKREGVKTIFGLPGGVVLKIFDVLCQRKDLDLILTRHEQGAARDREVDGAPRACRARAEHLRRLAQAGVDGAQHGCREQHDERQPVGQNWNALVQLERDQCGQPQPWRPPPPRHPQPFAVAHGLRRGARVCHAAKSNL